MYVPYHGIVNFLVAFALTVDTTRFSFDCREERDFSQDDFLVATSLGRAAIETSFF